MANAEAVSDLFLSKPDSGYSIDNLAPPPTELTIFETETSRTLLWNNPDIPDYLHTCIYRGTEPGFTPDEPLDCTIEQIWIEEHMNLFYYVIAHFDIHGNRGEYSNEVASIYPTGIPETIPAKPSLNQNIPNPFNPLTRIEFTLTANQHVRLKIYSLNGKLIATLLNEAIPAGHHEVIWSGQDDSGHNVASGSYIYHLDAGEYSATRRMVLIR